MHSVSISSTGHQGLVSLTLVVDMRFDVPVRIGIARVVFLGTGYLNLLETPLR